MNRELFFKSAGDERSTPQAFFDALHREFSFNLDAAASAENAKCELFFGTGGIADNALEEDWGGEGSRVWLNPPYSTAGAFVAKAREEADKGATVVMLLPARTDTKWWHNYVWNRQVLYRGYLGEWRRGVECRFVPGRLRFELKVSAMMRQWIKNEVAPPDTVRDIKIAGLVQQTGLPTMAIEGILADKADEHLLSSAPFPSCVVVFRPVT